ncbi:MAG: hypothetical protein Q8O99_05795 [bacterium]|nr:hypothetical protein [bacterium]
MMLLLTIQSNANGDPHCHCRPVLVACNDPLLRLNPVLHNPSIDWVIDANI